MKIKKKKKKTKKETAHKNKFQQSHGSKSQTKKKSSNVSLRSTKSLTDAGVASGPSRGRSRRRCSPRIASCSPHPSSYSAVSVRSLSTDSGVKKARRRRRSRGWSHKKRSRSRSAARSERAVAGPSQQHAREDDGADHPKPVQPVTTE